MYVVLKATVKKNVIFWEIDKRPLLGFLSRVFERKLMLSMERLLSVFLDQEVLAMNSGGNGGYSMANRVEKPFGKTP
jgi:hypothetical protein